ncbi:DNA-binding SAP [Penicillium herquei]|nr:DNA-binding SAP [Penicillium herquei]
MVDYSSWKVADLKAELKTRGIPQTGLRLKQHFIDKLVEEDAKAEPEKAATPVEEAETEPAAEPEPEPEIEQPSPETTPAPAQESQPEQSAEEPQQEAPIAPEEPSEPTPPQDEENHKEEDKSPQEESAEEPPKEKQAQDEDVEMTQAEPVVSEEKVEDQQVEQVPEETNEPAKTAEPSVPPTIQTSEANTELSTPLPIEEALEDKRKRKRRSQSPVPTPEAIANKKARALEGSPRVILQDDQESSTQEIEIKDSATEDQNPPAVQKEAPTAPKHDARFRDLFASARPSPAQPIQPVRPSSPSQDVTMEDAVVEAALHPATAALYIDGLMRPLQPNALRNHLVTLATAPGSEPKPDIIQDFFLDAIKTHCFAGFADVAAASRVRAALHGTVWPNERNRKTLRADFIPEAQIKEWIQTEESSRDRAGPPVRWEVRYEPGEDEQIQAVLSESGPNSRVAPPSRPREPGFNRTPPLGPRGSVTQADRRPSIAPPAPPSRPGQGFKPLDDLFESTTTKPKLYYLRVPRQVADKRLDQFDDLLKKGTFPRRGGDDMRRISFEDEDYFVDGGAEYGVKNMPRRTRGGRGGRGRD